MKLGLDLSQSIVKLDWAIDRYEALKTEAAALPDRNPLLVRAGSIDQNSGWASVYIRGNKLEEPLICTLVGDYVYNLRCALDYIVTALVKASGTPLTKRHQFPIYTDETLFRDNVLSDQLKPVSGGVLQGITVGLGEIDRVQPFHEKSNHHPETAYLNVLNEVSNADKHRMLTQAYGDIAAASLLVGPSDNVTFALEIMKSDVPSYIIPGQEVEIARMRYAVPCLHEVVIAPTGAKWRPLLVAELIGAPGDRVEFPIPMLRHLHRRVREVIDGFAAL